MSNDNDRQDPPRQRAWLMLSRHKLIAAVISVFLAAGGTFLAERPAGATATNHVSGNFTYAAQQPGACGLTALICATGTFAGGIQGTFTNMITSLVPSAVTGVFYYSGNISIVTSGGNLSCQLAGALSQTSPDGEFGEICEIRGGTGTYQGATGHLQLIGESDTSGTPILGLKGSGDYRGVINTPGNPSS